jgi:hypothetical protein
MALKIMPHGRLQEWVAEENVRRPEDLGGVEVGVGYHSRSHFPGLSPSPASYDEAVPA